MLASIALRPDAEDLHRDLAVRIDREVDVYPQAEAASVLVGHVDMKYRRPIRCSIAEVARFVVDCGIVSRIGLARRASYTRNVGDIEVPPIITENKVRRSAQLHELITAFVEERHGERKIFELRRLEECVGRSLWLGGHL